MDVAQSFFICIELSQMGCLNTPAIVMIIAIQDAGVIAMIVIKSLRVIFLRLVTGFHGGHSGSVAMPLPSFIIVRYVLEVKVLMKAHRIRIVPGDPVA